MARPPLFKVSKGAGKNLKVIWCQSEAERDKALRQLGKGAEAARMKGLGEMNAEELWETTMNPATRVLLQVVVDDVAAVYDTFEKLMGPDVEPRKKFSQAHAHSGRDLHIQGRIKGVESPATGSCVRTQDGFAYFLDVGANVDSKPEYMVQFAEMGAVYAREMLGRPQPRVALLSNGEEEGKGDERVRETTRRLKGTLPGFIGNVEPKDIYAARADVVVADGFVGNVAIKMAEATAEFLFRNLRDEIPKTLPGMLGGLLIRPGVRQLRDRIDWREVGGSPLLGITGVAVFAHGRSDARAMKNAIRVARDAVANQLVGKIRAEVGKA